MISMGWWREIEYKINAGSTPWDKEGAQLSRPLDKGVGGGGVGLQQHFFFGPSGLSLVQKQEGASLLAPLDLPLKIVQLTTY